MILAGQMAEEWLYLEVVCAWCDLSGTISLSEPHLLFEASKTHFSREFFFCHTNTNAPNTILFETLSQQVRGESQPSVVFFFF